MAQLNPVPEINKCANPDCDQNFQRLGEGRLTVLPVRDPAAWGLPPHIRQKVVWTCDRCSALYQVRLERKEHIVQLVPKAHRRAA